MKNILLFLVLFTSFGCKNKVNENLSALKISDSISYYISNSNSQSIEFKGQKNINNKALLLISKQKNTTNNRNHLYDIITNCYNLNDWITYNKASLLLLKNSYSVNDSIDIAKSHRSRGNYYSFIRNSYSSFFHYVKAEKIYRALKNNEGYSTILLKKGILQSNVNDLTGADLSLNLAYNIYKKSEEYNKIYAVLNQLGLVYRELKYFDKAIESHNKALEIVIKHKLKDNNEEANCLGNIGIVYEYKKDFKKANFYYQKSLKDKTTKKENPILYASLIDNLAYSKIQLNDKVNLIELLSESLKIRDSVNDKSFVVLSTIHFSEYYDKIKDTIKSIEFANKALFIAKKSKAPIDIVAALKQAAAVDKINASSYTNEYIHINDSLLTAERKNLDRFARIQLETDEVIKENKALGTEKQNLVYYLIGFTVLALVGGLLFVIFRQRTKQKELLFLQSQQDANENIYQLLLEQQAKVAEVRQSEKTRIALELHDGIMNKLASIRLNLFVLSEKTDPETISKCLDHITDIQTIETEIRNVAHDLNQEVFLEKNSFKLLISEFVSDQNSNQKTQFDIEMDPQIDWEKINNTIKVNLFRIIQEATNNCNKHANATRAVIAFVLDENKICMSFIDNGIGADLTTTKEGIGIKNMNQRIKLLEGSISIKSDASTGTQIYLAVPIDKL